MTAAGTQMARDLAEQIAELRSQRDELLAVTKRLVWHSDTFGDVSGKAIYADARLAISRAERNL